MASKSNSGQSKRYNQNNNSDTDDIQENVSGKEILNGKRLKKDDSGINVLEDNSSSDSEKITPKKTSSEISDPEVKTFEENSPDSGNTESCSFADLRLQEDEMVVDNGSVNPERASCSSSSVSPESKKEPESKFKTFCQMFNKISSSSDSDSLSEKVDDDSDSELASKKTKSDKKSNESYGYDPTPKTPKPKYKWNAPIAITSRQYGYSAKYSPTLFNYDCYGSLHVVERLELMYKMKKHEGCVNALHFNSKGTKLVSGSDDLDIVMWDWMIGEPIMSYNSGHRSNVFQAKFMPLGQDNFIVSCSRDGQVRVGELSSTGECNKTRKLASHKGAAHKLALQMDSCHTFLSCGEDAAVFQIDLRQEKPEKLLICKEKGKKVPLFTIHANPLKSFEYVIGGRNQYVKIYDTRFTQEDGGFVKNICPENLTNPETKNVTSVVYNYNGEEILVSYNDDDIYSFERRETDGSKFSHRYSGHKNSQTVKGVNYFGPKSEFIISGSDCGYVFFWEKESEHVVQYMYGDEGGVVNCLEPNPIVPILATSGLDDDIKIWVPSCENPPDLSGLRKHLISNMKEREDERRNCPEAFIDQTIWFLMQHLARSRGSGGTSSSPDRERRNIAVVELSSSSDSDSQDEDYSDGRREIQCNQS